MTKKEWFEDWFDSPYYHLLYKHRDDKEAAQFVTQLVHFLKPQPHARFLDLACGRGRHSIFLNSLGYDVTGVDLSPANIAHAKQFESDTLHFFEHDMRHVFLPQQFDFVVNLFTSFGYFDTRAENEAVICAMGRMIKPGGTVVLDYLNGNLVEAGEPATYTDENVVFSTHKKVVADKVIKEIEITDGKQTYAYREEVRIFSKADFESFFKAANLNITHVFGDYALQPFHESTSPRMIFIAQLNT